jgi:hypothetical protein
LQTPADFKAYRSEDTAATILGTAIHTALLENVDVFNAQYLPQTSHWGNRAAGEGKKKWDALKAQAKEENKIPLGWDEWMTISRILDAASDVPEWQRIDGLGKTEVSAFAKIGEIDYKGRIDMLSKTLCGSRPAIWDLKSTAKGITNDAIIRFILDTGAHFQAAHYLRVFNAAATPETEKIDDYGWIFVSTSGSASTLRMVPCPRDLLDWGKRDWNIAHERLYYCMQNDSWPGLSSVIYDLEIPDYLRKQYE